MRYSLKHYPTNEKHLMKDASDESGLKTKPQQIGASLVITFISPFINLSNKDNLISVFISHNPTPITFFWALIYLVLFLHTSKCWPDKSFIKRLKDFGASQRQKTKCLIYNPVFNWLICVNKENFKLALAYEFKMLWAKLVEHYRALLICW